MHMQDQMNISHQAPSVEEATDLYLEAGFYKADATDPIPASIKNTSRWYTARSEDLNLIGMGRVLTDWARVACIYDVIVVKAMRGRGIGKAIMQHIIEDMTSVPIPIIHLWPTKGNAAFYERLGFEALGPDQPFMKYAPQWAKSGSRG